MSEIETLENVVSMAEALERIAASPAVAALSCLPRDYWPRSTTEADAIPEGATATGVTPCPGADATIGAVRATGEGTATVADATTGAVKATSEGAATGATSSNGKAISRSAAKIRGEAKGKGATAGQSAAKGRCANTGDGEDKPLYPGAEIVDAIGSAKAPFSWEGLPGPIVETGRLHQLVMSDVLPPWPHDCMARLAWTACCIAGIAHRHNAWEMLGKRLQALAGVDDQTWRVLLPNALKFYIAGALSALGIGVDHPGTIKLLRDVTSEVPLLPWRQNFEREDGRVSWLRKELLVCESVSVATVDLVKAWRRHTATQGLPFDTLAKEVNRMGRAARIAFEDQIKRKLVLESENLTETQGGPCRRRRGMIGLAFRDALLFKQICSMP